MQCENGKKVEIEKIDGATFHVTRGAWPATRHTKQQRRRRRRRRRQRLRRRRRRPTTNYLQRRRLHRDSFVPLPRRRRYCRVSATGNMPRVVLQPWILHLVLECRFSVTGFPTASRWFLCRPRRALTPHLRAWCATRLVHRPRVHLYLTIKEPLCPQEPFERGWGSHLNTAFRFLAIFSVIPAVWQSPPTTASWQPFFDQACAPMSCAMHCPGAAPVLLAEHFCPRHATISANS